MALRQSFEFDPLLKLPRNMIFAGTTQSGKTSLFLKTLEKAAQVYNPVPKRVYFLYNCFQPSYIILQQKLQEKGMAVEFMKGSSLKEDDLQSIADPDGGQTIVVIDDATVTTTQSNELGHLFTVARHYQVSIVLMWHVIFAASPASRIISQNTGYFVLLNSPRMGQQVAILGSQIGLKKVLQAAYDNETQKPYGYVLVDLTPSTPKSLRVRTNILSENQTVFAPTN